jgi:hypothetical protein
MQQLKVVKIAFIINDIQIISFKLLSFLKFIQSGVNPNFNAH